MNNVGDLQGADRNEARAGLDILVTCQSSRTLEQGLKIERLHLGEFFSIEDEVKACCNVT